MKKSPTHLKHKHNHGFTLFYQIEQALGGLWSNRLMTIASILVLSACLVVIGSFYLLVCNIDYNTSDISHLNKIIVYLNEDYTEKEVGTVKATIEDMKDLVQGVTLITKEQALEEERKKYEKEYPHMFDALEEGENPYRDSLEITYQEGISVKVLSDKLTQMDGIERVVSYPDIADSVNHLKTTISRAFTAFILVLFAVTVFIIILTIRFAVISRREEVKIMRYIGATMHFIAAPYILEGIFIGLCAACIAAPIQKLIYLHIADIMQGAVTPLPYSEVGSTLLIGFLAIGCLTGVIGSGISLYRYLRV